MKKILLILLLLIPIGLLVSCSDDVVNPTSEYSPKLTVTFNNVAVVNGNIYATQDYPLEVESVKVFQDSDNSTEIEDVEYTIDGKMTTKSSFAPFAGRFDTRTLTVGTHPLGLSFDLLEGNNTQVVDNMQYNFIVVPSVDDLPNNADLGTFTQTFKVS